MAANKTDANDADGLAHLAEVGFFREARVKVLRQHAFSGIGRGSHETDAKDSGYGNQIGALMKTFSLIVPCSMGDRFEVHVRSLLADNTGLSRIILPLLEAWGGLRLLAAGLGKQLLRTGDTADLKGFNPAQLSELV
ncbi:hypothetical protein FHX15_005946 [Rhizobium sp. BK650]|nr:hypothetical protein [Rhizobium sp. BK650]